MTEDREKLLINDFALVDSDQLAGEEFDMNIAEMNRDESKRLDIYFVSRIGTFALKGFEGDLTGTGKRTWRNEFKRIARGEYPLEELPEHVREQARELYYNQPMTPSS